MSDVGPAIAALERAIAAIDGRAGILLAAEDGRVAYEHDADGAFTAASVIKIPLLMTVYAEAAAGRLSLEERLAVGERVLGSGVLRHLPDLGELSIRDHATLATIVSDNTATNRLLDRLGVAHIDERMREWGCRTSRFRRRMFDADAARRGEENVLTPRETSALLFRLVRGELVDRPTAAAVIALMEQTQDPSGLRRFLPAGTRVAHKTGSLERTRNDAGIVFGGEGAAVAAAFVDGVADARVGQRLLGLVGWIALGLAGGDAEGLPAEWPEGR